MQMIPAMNHHRTMVPGAGSVGSKPDLPFRSGSADTVVNVHVPLVGGMKRIFQVYSCSPPQKPSTVNVATLRAEALLNSYVGERVPVSSLRSQRKFLNTPLFDARRVDGGVRGRGEHRTRQHCCRQNIVKSEMHCADRHENITRQVADGIISACCLARFGVQQSV